MRSLLIICFITSIFTINIDAACDYLNHITHKCMNSECIDVHNALVVAGFHPSLPKHYYQYWSSEILKNIGYQEIKKPSSFKKGDITVTENNNSHPDGHIAMWTGNKWVSGFFQESEFVYSYNQPPVHYFRYSGPTQSPKGCNEKTVNQIAVEVIQGKWGVGEERIKKLTDAGCDYDAIKNEVNKLLDYNNLN